MCWRASLRVWLDGAEHALASGDYASIPAGTGHRWEGDAFFTKAISMSTPGGLEQLLDRAGEPTELHMFGAERRAAVGRRARAPPRVWTCASPRRRRRLGSRGPGSDRLAAQPAAAEAVVVGRHLHDRIDVLAHRRLVGADRVGDRAARRAAPPASRSASIAASRSDVLPPIPKVGSMAWIASPIDGHVAALPRRASGSRRLKCVANSVSGRPARPAHAAPGASRRPPRTCARASAPACRRPLSRRRDRVPGHDPAAEHHVWVRPGPAHIGRHRAAAASGALARVHGAHRQGHAAADRRR